MKTLYTINTGNNFMDIIYKPFGLPYLERNPDVKIINIMDDSLLTQTIQGGGVTPLVTACMYNYAQAAQMSGADAILSTCTSVNQATKQIRKMLQIPMINIEEPVAEAALLAGKKIGIIGTVPSSPVAMELAILDKAQELGKTPEIVKVVAEGAYDQLLQGNRAKHDEMICAKLYELAKEVDVVVFSQISMALLEHDELPVPRFKIGDSGFDKIHQMMMG